MSQVEIYFFGLICFVHENETPTGNITSADVVQAPGHCSVVYTPQMPSRAATHFDQSIKFIGTTTVVYTIDDCFVMVPSVQPHVQPPNCHHTASSVQIEMPPGILTVAVPYPVEGQFKNGDRNAMARLLVLIADADDDVSVVMGGRTIATIQKDSWGLVANVGPAHKCMPGGSHFEHYLDVTTGTSIDWLCDTANVANLTSCKYNNRVHFAAEVMDWVFHPNLTGCPHDMRPAPIATQVDCSPSQFP